MSRIAIACLVAASVLAPSMAEARSKSAWTGQPSPRPEYVLGQEPRLANVQSVRKEEVPVIENRREATRIYVYDVVNSGKVYRRPVVTEVYVSSDPFDHVH